MNKSIDKNKKVEEICFSCDGEGKIRNNKSENGKYTFGKIKCENCNGTGKEKVSE